MKVGYEQLVHFSEQHAHLGHADGSRATTVEHQLFGARNNERADAKAYGIWRWASSTSEKNNPKSL